MLNIVGKKVKIVFHLYAPTVPSIEDAYGAVLEWFRILLPITYEDMTIPSQK